MKDQLCVADQIALGDEHFAVATPQERRLRQEDAREVRSLKQPNPIPDFRQLSEVLRTSLKIAEDRLMHPWCFAWKTSDANPRSQAKPSTWLNWNGSSRPRSGHLPPT
jgi:hypothetical protein